MRLAAAVTWYRQGKVSQEVAARIAGLDRTDFLLALARMREILFGRFRDLDKELWRVDSRMIQSQSVGDDGQAIVAAHQRITGRVDLGKACGR